MAKKSEAAKLNDDGQVEARVLRDCAHGRADEVVTVDSTIADADDALDPHPDAVAYAKSLKD